MPGCSFLKTRTTTNPNLRNRQLAIVQFLKQRQNPPKGVPGPLLDRPPLRGVPDPPKREDRPEKLDYRPEETNKEKHICVVDRLRCRILAKDGEGSFATCPGRIAPG